MLSLKHIHRLQLLQLVMDFAYFTKKRVNNIFRIETDIQKNFVLPIHVT